MADVPPTQDFAVLTHAGVDLGLVLQAAELLPAELGEGALVGVETFGRRASGEVAVLFRFSLVVAAGPLLSRMEAVAARLGGRLVALSGAGPEREAWAGRLAGFDVQPQGASSPAAALQSFRERMGLGPLPEAPAVSLSFGTADELLASYARYVAEGSIFIPTPRRMLEGAQLRLLFVAPGIEPLEAMAQVVRLADRGERGVHATLVPGHALREFVRKKVHAQREGRASAPATGLRHHERFDTCLEVRFRNFPELLVEFASNISRGGLFAKTYTPPAVRARVRLVVHLPNGEDVETDAEVMHVVTVEDALARGLLPGAGLSFVTQNAEFDGRIAALIDRYRARKPRVLVVDDDALFRASVGDALAEAGMDPVLAASGEEALTRLTEGLFALDLVVLDLKMPGLDGAGLLRRIRRLGGEADVRVMVLSGGRPEELAALKGPGGANDVVEKGTPMAEVVDRVRRLLGR